MKRNLLLIASLFISAMSFAQGWVKPDVPAGTTFELSTDDVQNIYYLYNREAGAFWTEGGYWGTNAVYGDTGLKSYFTQFVSEEPIESLTENTVKFHTYTLKKDRWDLSFYDTDATIYDDWGGRTGKPDTLWCYELNGNAIRLYPADCNPNITHATMGDGYSGIDLSDEGNTAIKPLLDINEEGVEGVYCVDWELISLDDYEQYLTGLATYNAAVALGDYIQEVLDGDYATDANVQAKLQDAQAVYDNTSSTLEEINAAKEALRLAVGYAVIGDASEDDPRDATMFIENATFDNNIDGWICTYTSDDAAEFGWLEGNPNKPGQSHYNTPDDGHFLDNAIQAWGGLTHTPIGDGKLYQILPSLPAGKYEFTVDACAVIEGQIGTECSGLELYAIGGEYEVADNISTGQYGNYVPKQFKVVFVSTGGNIELGGRSVSTNANWFAMDNFTLTYYGPVEGNPDKIILEDYIKKCEEQYPDLDEVYAYCDVKEAYETSLNNAKDGLEETDPEPDYLALRNDLRSKKEALDNSVSEYETINTKITTVEEKADQFNGHEHYQPIADQLADLANDLREKYEDGTATSEDISGIDSIVSQIISDGIRQYMQAGDEVTLLISDPDFSRGGVDWGGECVAASNFQINTNATYTNDEVEPAVTINKFIELWRAGAALGDGWMATQIANVPEGLYTLGVDAIACDQVSGTAAEDIVGMSLYAVEEDGTTQRQALGTAAGTPQHFELSFLKNNAEAILEIGGLVESTNANWLAMDNFTLTYMGKDADAMQATLENLITECTELSAEVPGVQAAQDLLDAIATASDAVGQSYDTMKDAYLALSTARTAAKKNINAYNELYEAIEDLDEAMTTYAETATETAYTYAETVMGEVADKWSNGEYTTDDALAQVDVIEDAIARLRIPVIPEGVSEENPFDMTVALINPAYDESTETSGKAYTGTKGWTFENEGPVTHMNISTTPRPYGAEEPTMTNFAQMWCGTGEPVGNGKIEQTLNYLPAGYYVLGAYVIAANENFEEYSLDSIYEDTALVRVDTIWNEYVVDGMQMYALENGVEASLVTKVLQTEAGQPEHASVLLNKVGGEESSISFGVRTIDTNGNWIGCDNWTLTYLGTDEPTGIETTEELVKNNLVGNVYNLAGQKVNAMTPGNIYIINGKKVLLK